MTDEFKTDPASLPPIELRRLAGKARKRFQQSEGGELAQTVLGATKIRQQMKADGATQAEIDRYFENVLRQSWPRGRSEPWHYLCDQCSDTGLVIRVCRPGDRCDGISTRIDHWRDKPGKYSRLCARNLDYTHEYGEPCTSCERGNRFRETAKHGPSADANIGRRKPRELSRFGE